MKIHTCTMNSAALIDRDVVACIGYFDGLHKGHMALVENTIAKAKELNADSVLITFDPDPWVIIKQVVDVQHLTTMKQRQKLAEEAGLDHFVVLEFTKEMSALSEKQFVELLCRNLPLKGMICGFDFHYGSRGSGNAATLATHGFEVVCVQSVNDEQGKISSTRICECIDEGNMESAMALLGYAYTIEGRVVHGNAKGTGIGFPTANIMADSEFIIPARGVYVGSVMIDEISYPAMINIGYNPTFNKRRLLSIEAHLLDFHQNIYDKEVSVAFYKKIRSEKRFNSIDELIEQLNKDVEVTREYFR